MARLLESAWLRSLGLWLAIVASIFALSACQQGPAGPSGPEAQPAPGTQPVPPEAVNPPHMAGRTAVRVALLLPLSASDREIRQVAQSLLDSGQLAVFEVGNPDLLLIPKDTRGTATGADAAAREALAQGAELILGPLLRDEVLAVAPIARQARVPVLAFSTDRGVAGGGVYLLSFQPEQEVARVTQYAVSQGRRSFAAMIPNSDYGSRVRDAFMASVEKNGGRLIALQGYERSPAAMSDPVKSLADYQKRTISHGYDYATPASGAGDLEKLQQYQSFGTSPFDAVLLPEGGTLLRALAPLLPYYDVDPRKVKFLGTGLWDDPVIGREPALAGGWFAAPSPDARNAFLSRFSQAYGATPARIASLSFDAVALAGSLARLPARERFSPETFANSNGFTGIDGIFRFAPDGSTERGLAVLEVTENGFKIVSPAPATFQLPPQF